MVEEQSRGLVQLLSKMSFYCFTIIIPVFDAFLKPTIKTQFV